MPILKAVIESLDTLGDELCVLDMSRPRHNLTALGVKHTFEEDTKPSFVVRDAESQEAKLVAPGTKGVYEDMLARIGVQHANLGIEADKELDAQAFEEFYDKTVDLADLCQLPDVNERLNQVANSYQEFSIRREELSTELKRLAVIPRIKQRLAKLPQMRKELEETIVQRQEMEGETKEYVKTLDAMEKDISYLRMEHSMDQENEEQAMAQLNAKKSELEKLKAELETKKRLLESRKEAYRKRRPLTAVEHSERMLGELMQLKESSAEDDPSLHEKRSMYNERLSDIISNSDAIEVTNRYMDKVFANTIDSVANEDVDSLEARRASRRLSMTAATPSGRVLAAQLLCILYTQSQADQAGILEEDLRTQITDFARERQWNPDLTVQAMYEVFAKKLAKRYRDDRTHMVRLLWD
ncbi:hypothetical protein IW140_005175 [Coemansia sp. RSA 1813]|nr:hypothetical protein EV178_003764 [Coemansia sp. RSA 1646]KAJ1769720.1 hypothetical protein LPJ74_003809 [Coemansia sp. RSA 1843]KAJ2089033.1 hypothetical protein IW138_003745 [Coemansia sp. RSA 986]KAJ2213474.1 hypothetical protein EV179_003793 [Coemansia sp. RSA 487]KAJ2565833.1 hypothetical protein IW140_005175 [Coemansia sp. RSA 1813]